MTELEHKENGAPPATGSTSRKPRPLSRWIIWLLLAAGSFFATLHTRDDPQLFAWGVEGLLPLLCLLMMILFTAITLHRSILLSLALIGLAAWAGVNLDPELYKPLDHMFVWGLFIAGIGSLVVRFFESIPDGPRHPIRLPDPLGRFVPGTYCTDSVGNIHYGSRP